MRFKIYLLPFSIFIGFSFSHAQSPEGVEGFRAGPALAVQEANLKDGFRLSDKAKEVIGVKTKKLGTRPFSISQSSIVHYGDKAGVYRYRDGWFKLIEVQIQNKSQAVEISSSELRDNDEVAVQGVALLRVSEMDAFGGEE